MSGGEERGSGEGYWSEIHDRREEIVTVREEMTRERGPVGAVIDRIGMLIARPHFFAGLLLLHLAWIVANSGWIPGVDPWDPYPFMLLATIASAEAPFIALLVLMRQQRDQYVSELRDEVALQVELHMEREATTLLRMVDQIRDHLGIEDSIDEDGVDAMKEELDPRRLMRSLEEHLEEAEEEPPAG